LLDPEDRVLLIHARDPDAPEHQWWELPGGGVDPGETLTDTAIREVAEETGLVLKALGPYLWCEKTGSTTKDTNITAASTSISSASRTPGPV
jgi:8-oxo-dGTP pyrophosphatase MutT (NUDIX family)